MSVEALLAVHVTAYMVGLALWTVIFGVVVGRWIRHVDRGWELGVGLPWCFRWRGRWKQIAGLVVFWWLSASFCSVTEFLLKVPMTSWEALALLGLARATAQWLGPLVGALQYLVGVSSFAYGAWLRWGFDRRALAEMLTVQFALDRWVRVDVHGDLFITYNDIEIAFLTTPVGWVLRFQSARAVPQMDSDLGDKFALLAESDRRGRETRARKPPIRAPDEFIPTGTIPKTLAPTLAPTMPAPAMMADVHVTRAERLAAAAERSGPMRHNDRASRAAGARAKRGKEPFEVVAEVSPTEESEAFRTIAGRLYELILEGGLVALVEQKQRYERVVGGFIKGGSSRTIEVARLLRADPRGVIGFEEVPPTPGDAASTAAFGAWAKDARNPVTYPRLRPFFDSAIDAAQLLENIAGTSGVELAMAFARGGALLSLLFMVRTDNRVTDGVMSFAEPMTDPAWPPTVEAAGGYWEVGMDEGETKHVKLKDRFRFGPFKWINAYSSAGGRMPQLAADLVRRTMRDPRLMGAASALMKRGYHHWDQPVMKAPHAIPCGGLTVYLPDGRRVTLKTSPDIVATMCGPFLATGRLGGDDVVVPVDLGYPARTVCLDTNCGDSMARSVAGPLLFERTMMRLDNEFEVFARREYPGPEDGSKVVTLGERMVPPQFKGEAFGLRCTLDDLRSAVLYAAGRAPKYRSGLEFAETIKTALAHMRTARTLEWYTPRGSYGPLEVRAATASLLHGRGAVDYAKARRDTQALLDAARGGDGKAIRKLASLIECKATGRFAARRELRRAAAIDAAAHDSSGDEATPEMDTAGTGSTAPTPVVPPPLKHGEVLSNAPVADLMSVTDPDATPDVTFFQALLNGAVGGLSVVGQIIGSIIRGVRDAFVGAGGLTIDATNNLIALAARAWYTLNSAPAYDGESEWSYTIGTGRLVVTGNAEGPHLDGRPVKHGDVLARAMGGRWSMVKVTALPEPRGGMRWVDKGNEGVFSVPAGMTGARAEGTISNIIMVGALVGAIEKLWSVIRAVSVFVCVALGVPLFRDPKDILAECAALTSGIQALVYGSTIDPTTLGGRLARAEEVVREAGRVGLNRDHAVTALLNAMRVGGVAHARQTSINNATKVQPIVLMLVGPGGTYKDTTADFLAQQIGLWWPEYMARERELAGAAFEPHEHRVYAYKGDSEFWSAFNDPTILWYQDALADTSADGRTADGKMLINAMSGAPYSVDGSDVSEKGKRLRHKLAILTSNVPDRVELMGVPVNPGALKRRLSFIVESHGVDSFELRRADASTGFEYEAMPGRPGKKMNFVTLLETVKEALLHNQHYHFVGRRELLRTSEVDTELLSTLRRRHTAPMGAAAGPVAEAQGLLSLALTAAVCFTAGYALPAAYAKLVEWKEGAIGAAERGIRAVVAGLGEDVGAGIVAFVARMASYAMRFARESATRVWSFLRTHTLALAGAAAVAGGAFALWSYVSAPPPVAAPEAGKMWYDSAARKRVKHVAMHIAVKMVRSRVVRAEGKQTLGIANAISNNVVLVTVMVPKSGAYTVHGWFPRKGVLATVGHAFSGIDGNACPLTSLLEDGVFTFTHNRKSYTYAMGDCKVWRSMGNSDDLLLIELENGPDVRSLEPHIASSADFGGATNCALIGVDTNLEVGLTNTVEANVSYDVTRGTVTTAYHTNIALEYEGGLTKNGHCAMPLYDKQTGEIIGMHICTRGSKSYAMPFCLQYLDALAPATAQMVRNDLDPGAVVRPLGELCAGVHDSYGGKSSLVATAGPERDALEAVAGCALKLPSKELHKRPLAVTAMFDSVPTRDNLFPGDWDWSVAGAGVVPPGRYSSIGYEEACALLDHTTSPGLPHTAAGVHHKGELMPGGKHAERGRAACDALWEKLLRHPDAWGDDERPLYSVKAKDELIKVGKAMRPIVAVSYEVNVCMARLFRTLLDASVECCVHPAMTTSVGINPFGPQWGELWRQTVPSDGKVLLTMDAKRLDQHVTRQAVDALGDLLARAHDDPVRVKNALAALTRGYWVFDMTAYEVRGRNPSGNMLTVLVNDFVMANTFLYAGAKMWGVTPREARARMWFRTYGDDSLVHLPAGTDANAFMRLCSDVNVHMTWADKLEHPADYVEPLESVTYLKRTFVEVTSLYGKVVVGPLERRSIASSVAAYKVSDKHGLYYSQRFRAALLEASLWEPEFYHAVRDQGVAVLRAKSWIYAPRGMAEDIPSYEECRHTMVASAAGKIATVEME